MKESKEVKKHTKGKWIVDGDVVSNGDRYICQINYNEDSKEEEANAKLIASAPELLEALNLLMNVISRNSKFAELSELDQNTMEKVQEAIKNATV